MADDSDVTRIVAVRHGETVWNAEMRMQGQLDTALSARGQRQARRAVFEHRLAEATHSGTYTLNRRLLGA